MGILSPVTAKKGHSVVFDGAEGSKQVMLGNQGAARRIFGAQELKAVSFADSDSGGSLEEVACGCGLQMLQQQQQQEPKQ